MRAALLALLFVAFGPAAAHAALPAYEPGVAYIYDNGRVEQVRAVSGPRVTWAARTGRTYERALNPVVPILAWSFRGQTGTRRIVGDPDKLFPLKPGRRVQFQSVNETRTETGRMVRSVHLWRCGVRAREAVSTPAGTFSAFPIVCDRYSPNTMRVLERLTWHFSEEIGHTVKREVRDMRDGTADVYRLYAVIPAWEANPVRLEAVAKRAERGRAPG